jgi:hypothetical protein
VKKTYTEQALLIAKRRFIALKKANRSQSLSADEIAELMKLGKELDAET